jgi:hypothetical protein
VPIIDGPGAHYRGGTQPHERLVAVGGVGCLVCVAWHWRWDCAGGGMGGAGAQLWVGMGPCGVPKKGWGCVMKMVGRARGDKTASANSERAEPRLAKRRDDLARRVRARTLVLPLDAHGRDAAQCHHLGVAQAPGEERQALPGHVLPRVSAARANALDTPFMRQLTGHPGCGSEGRDVSVRRVRVPTPRGITRRVGVLQRPCPLRPRAVSESRKRWCRRASCAAASSGGSARAGMSYAGPAEMCGQCRDWFTLAAIARAL